MRTGIPRPGRGRCAVAAALVGATALASPVAGPSQDAPPQKLFAEEPHLGVVARIDAYVPHTVNPARAFRAAFDRIADLERKFSSYRDDSEIRRVEDLAWKRPVPVSDDLSTLLQLALSIARETGGAFDPTIGALTRLAHERGLSLSPHRDQAFVQAGRLTGWQQVALDSERNTVFLMAKGVQFDLGGIAKGFIADEALRELANRGIESAMVAIAGDIAVGGPPPGERGWTVGLDAVGTRGGVERVLTVANQGVSTSGSRARSYRVGKRRCSHILSPTVGSCTDPDIAVSAVAPTAAEADGLATALVAMGRERSETLLSKRPEIKVYWAGGASARGPSPSSTSNAN